MPVSESTEIRELRVSEEFYEQLKQLAHEAGMSLSGLLRGCLEVFVEKGVTWIDNPVDPGAGNVRARMIVDNDLWAKAEAMTWTYRVHRANGIRMIANEMVRNRSVALPVKPKEETSGKQPRKRAARS